VTRRPRSTVGWVGPSFQKVGKRFVSSGIGEFLGRQPRGGVQLTTVDEGVDLVGERGDVADGDRPFVCVASYGLTGETQLQGPVRQGSEVQVPLGVPLYAGGRTLQLTLPGGSFGVHPADVTRQARMPQRPLEAVTADLDSEDGLLP
jgi:hypothetical protein